ncbi:MAG: response regulator, partial [Planctomycetota bacterium]
MQDDGWKKTLSELSLDELKEAQRFINELIPMLQAVENPTDAPAEALTEAMVEEYKSSQLEEFPPSTGGERREDTRFDIEIDGVYAIIKGEETESELQMLNLQIKDVSKQGIRFVTNQFVLPSNILIIKFHLPSSDTRQLYKKIIQKKIYAEVRRVIGLPTPRGMQYQVGAKSIEREEALELAKENEGFTITGKRLALKADVTVLIVSIREAHAKHLEKLLNNLGYSTYRESQKPYAIATLRKIDFNIVVTDMVTAGIQEFELIKDLKNEFPEICLVVEIETLEDWFQVSSLGANEYISKDFTDKEFEMIINFLHKKLLHKNIFGDYYHTESK